MSTTLAKGRELERQRICVRVEHEVPPVAKTLDRKGQASRVARDIGLVELDAVPVYRNGVKQVRKAHARRLRGYAQPEVDQLSHETMKTSVLLEKAPVEPGELAVVAVRVVVASLGAAHFIAHQHHRHTER